MDKEAVFDSKFKSLESVIETYEETEEECLAAVLRSDLYAKMIKNMRERSANKKTGQEKEEKL